MAVAAGQRKARSFHEAGEGCESYVEVFVMHYRLELHTTESEGEVAKVVKMAPLSRHRGLPLCLAPGVSRLCVVSAVDCWWLAGAQWAC